MTGHPLQPVLRNGVIHWTPATFVFHALWGYQFIVALVMEYVLCVFATVSSPRLGEPVYSPYPQSSTPTVLALINALFVLVVIAEACMYANVTLNTDRYLVLQSAKMVYVSILYAWYYSIRNNSPVWRIDPSYRNWDTPWANVIFWIPWFGSLTYAICLKVWEGRNGETNGKNARVVVTVTEVDEESALLE